MTIEISAEQPRSIRAIEIAATSGQWLKCRAAGGEKAYGVPSQRQAGVYHLVTTASCTCPDFERRQEACKHVLAVRLVVELAKAQPKRRHVQPSNVVDLASRRRTIPAREEEPCAF